MSAKPPSNLPLSSPGGSQNGGFSQPSLTKKGESSSKKNLPTPGVPIPLAPKSFKNPKQKKGNGRKVIAVIFGSLIVIFLIGAIGLVVFRLFLGNGDDNQSQETGNNNQEQVTQTNKEQEDPVDFGPWTTPPPCLNVSDQAVWISDPDGDMLTNAEERLFGTDPCNEDTSGDGVMDGDAIEAGQNPLGPGRLDFAKYGLPDPAL